MSLNYIHSYSVIINSGSSAILPPQCRHIEKPPVQDDKPISVVTGGGGFIGIHLCKQLLKLGHRVYCVDIKNSFLVQHQFLGESDFVYIQCDVLDLMKPKYNKIHACGHCQTAVNIFQYHNVEKIDYIYHLACYASPPVYQKNKNKTMNVNVSGTDNVIQLAKNTNARLLLASTSEVYGEPINHPQSETDPLNVRIGPRACYDVGKIAAEVLLNDADLPDKRIARIFNTYGPGLCDGRVMSNFIEQALDGKNLTIYGDGSQTRSFCYIDDTVWGLIKLMNSDYDQPVNIGNPTEISIKQLAQLIIEKINPQLQITHLELPTDDPTRRCPNIQLAQGILNWAPETNLNDGIVLTIAWWKSKKNNAQSTQNSYVYTGNHGC